MHLHAAHTALMLGTNVDFSFADGVLLMRLHSHTHDVAHAELTLDTATFDELGALLRKCRSCVDRVRGEFSQWEFGKQRTVLALHDSLLAHVKQDIMQRVAGTPDQVVALWQWGLHVRLMNGRALVGSYHDILNGLFFECAQTEVRVIVDAIAPEWRATKLDPTRRNVVLTLAQQCTCTAGLLYDLQQQAA